MLTRSGDVYTAGYNDNGQCGVGATQRVGQLTLVEKLAGKGAAQVRYSHCCFISTVCANSGLTYCRCMPTMGVSIRWWCYRTAASCRSATTTVDRQAENVELTLWVPG